MKDSQCGSCLTVINHSLTYMVAVSYILFLNEFSSFFFSAYSSLFVTGNMDGEDLWNCTLGDSYVI